MSPGTLYVVATPIGNLEDVTLRALSVLRSVAVIACEDTRRTRVLLDRHGIAGRLVAFHKFNEAKASPSLVGRMVAGEDVALVSDGGTPAISDPGYRLVRDALDAGITVTPIPGPSAFVAAVSASGLPSERIVFIGFLPHRAGERRRAIETIRDERGTHVLYESPHRIEACLADLRDVLGNRRAAVARELTKRYETWYRGTLDEIAQGVAAGSSKGEFCIVIEGAHMAAAKGVPPSGVPKAVRSGSGEGPAIPKVGQGVEAGGLHETVDALRLRALYETALTSGVDRREALRRAARECGLSRKEAYRLLHPD